MEDKIKKVLNLINVFTTILLALNTGQALGAEKADINTYLTKMAKKALGELIKDDPDLNLVMEIVSDISPILEANKQINLPTPDFKAGGFIHGQQGV
jgi:hypothetical protein